MTNDFSELFATWRELEAVGSTTLTVSHEDVIRLTVAELISKYRSLRKMSKGVAKDMGEDIFLGFESVLRFYLDEDEFQQVIAELAQVGLGD